MREFIKLQFKLKWGLNRNNSKVSAAMTASAAVLAVALSLVLVYMLAFVLFTAVSVSAKRLCVLYLTVVMIGLTVYAIGMQANRLYRPGDLKITARFPLSSFQIFVSYLILNYIDICIYSTMFLLPILLAFGAAVKCLGWVYFGGIVLGLLTMPILPYALSTFLAIPVMFFKTVLERHGIVRLIIFILFLVGCFTLYYYLLMELSQFFIHRNWEEGTLEIWEQLLAALDTYYNPAYYLGNIIFFDRFWLGLGVMLGGGIVLSAGGIALAKLVYSGVRNRALEDGFGVLKKRTSLDDFGNERAILRFGLREIMRTKTYSYFYLGVAISTPVMVFFCERLVHDVGVAQIGSGINFGVAMLVVSVFMAMICSFSGETLSLEGKNFYITKLIPVSYRKQLILKALLNITVSLGALSVSGIVMGILQFIDAAQMAVLLGTEILFVIGLVFNGLNLNLVNPNLKAKANGEPEEINISYVLMIGIVIAAILGAVAILFPRIFLEWGSMWAYLLSGGIGLVYALVNFLVFWFTVNEKYRKIEG